MMRSLCFVFVLVGCTAPTVGVGEGEGEGEGELLSESEPNDGAIVSDVNALPIDAVITGSFGSAGDTDFFAVATRAGGFYRVTLEVPPGSLLDGHLTILDSGRGGDAAGEDYVRLGRGPEGSGAVLEMVAFGAGHLVIVRDARAVDGDAQGSDEHTYQLHIEASELPSEPLAFPSSIDGALPDVGGVSLYAFDAVEDADFTVDLVAAGDLDARLFVFSVDQGDWVARNDDRVFGEDVNPLMDAFFPLGGPSLLIVESTAERATNLGYRLTTSGNAP